MPARLLTSVYELCIIASILLSFSVTNLQVNAFRFSQKNAPSLPACRPFCSYQTKMAASSASATVSPTIPNWRDLKDPSDETNQQETAQLLRERSTWSDQSYRDALNLYDRLTSCTDSYVAGPIEVALNALDHAFRLYGPESVLCSFNGGKDAVVILHLVRAAHAHYCSQQIKIAAASAGNKPFRVIRPRVVYWDHKDEFPEILDFLHQTVETNDIDMLSFEQGVKFSHGLATLVENNTPADAAVPFPMAFVLGTRATDPNADQQGHFAPSSHFMPPFMRVNPVLEWTYGHVWHFLRLFQLPYCSLYDAGYTSLGTTENTLPCPALEVVGDNESCPKFWPAYMLRDWDQERAGRLSKESVKAAAKEKSNVTDDSEVSISRSNSGLTNLSTMSETRAAAAVINKVPEEIANISASPSKLMEDSASVVSYSSDKVLQKTVGILVIGDEILKGFTADTNTQAAAKALRDQNVLLKTVVVVSDDQEEIVQEIGRMRQKVDVIITSGGVGPTHDDVTIKSVAAALDCDLIMHEEMAQLLRDKMNDGADVVLTDAQIKMATLPMSSKLRYLSDNPKDWPVLQCRNIFILPGVPEFFAQKIGNVANYLSCQMQRGTTYKVVLSADENSIVPALNKVVKNHPNVTFGSYPFVSHPEYKTVITVEARMTTSDISRSNSGIFDFDTLDMLPKGQADFRVQLALDELLNTLPNGSILRVENDDPGLFS